MARKTTSKPRARKTAATKKTRTARASTPAKKEAPARDLLKELVALLRERGTPVQVRGGNGRYSILLVGGKSVAYIHVQTRNGIRVEPALAPADLPKGEARKLITPNGPKKTGQFLVSGVVPADKLDVAARVVELAVAKRG